MAQEFGESSDQGDQNAQGFEQNQADNAGNVGLDMTPEELAALRKRDENAQAHIQRLETENSELRDNTTRLANELDSATTLEDVIKRLDGKQGEQPNTTFDPDKVAEQVEQRLQSKASERVQEDNWNEVYGTLTETYGNWDKANVEVQARANQLGMSTKEATALARRSPTAFNELFLPRGTSTPAQSSASSASGKQTSHPEPQGQVRDKAYYKQLKKDSRAKFNSLEVQKQMWADLYGDN